MDRSFFVISPVELIGFLKHAGWSIKDLRGLGRIRDVIAWLKAIAEYAKKEQREQKK